MLCHNRLFECFFFSRIIHQRTHKNHSNRFKCIINLVSLKIILVTLNTPLYFLDFAFDNIDIIIMLFNLVCVAASPAPFAKSTKVFFFLQCIVATHFEKITHFEFSFQSALNLGPA